MPQQLRQQYYLMVDHLQQLQQRRLLP
jgi:hypothetical protein